MPRPRSEDFAEDMDVPELQAATDEARKSREYDSDDLPDPSGGRSSRREGVGIDISVKERLEARLKTGKLSLGDLRGWLHALLNNEVPKAVKRKAGGPLETAAVADLLDEHDPEARNPKSSVASNIQRARGALWANQNTVAQIDSWDARNAMES